MSVGIVFEAHATTFDNEAHLSSGWNDVGLSALGLEQAGELGKRRMGERFDVIFVSDLQRAVKTAEIAFGGRGMPIIKDSRLRECNYGDLTQHPSVEIDARKLESIAVPFPGGESYTETTARMASFLEELRRDYQGGRVLIIGHRATQYGLDNLIGKIPLETLVSARFKWQPGWEYELV